MHSCLNECWHANHFLLSELPKRNLKRWKGPRIHILQREDQRKHPNRVWSLEEHNKKQLLVQSTMWALHDCASLPELVVTVSMNFDVLCVQVVICHHLVSSSVKILCAGYLFFCTTLKMWPVKCKRITLCHTEVFRLLVQLEVKSQCVYTNH